MCGIVGYIARKGKVNPETLRSMRDELAHRGPDDAGIYINENEKVGLAHRRLSIIDLTKKGRQPMSDNSGSVWIVFNGEIYNFREIRKELEDLGYLFNSKTDTEVVINAYKEWGIECVYKFNGMFAFVIYDAKMGKLFLARDRFGIKPLYYSFFGDFFAFASEIKAIAKHPSFAREIDYGAVGDFFKYRYIPAPKSVWKGAFKLPQGYWAEFDASDFTLKKTKYYNLLENIEGKVSDLEEVEFLIEDAVRKRLISDVEAGVFLSGGVDSSSITYFCKKYNDSIRSFSIGFEPSSYSELEYSNKAARHLGTNHITRIIKDFELEDFENIWRYFDEPHADSSNIPTFLLSETTSEHVKVALSGDGGDEAFSGYNWYKNYLQDLSFFGGLKRKLITGNKFSPKTDIENYYARLLLNRFDNFSLGKLFEERIKKAATEGVSNVFEKYDNELGGVRRLQFIDLNTFLVDDILVKVDRASMAHSLEARVPFLDHRLVEAVFSLDEETFPTNSTDKPVLKKIMRERLPQEILNRKKKGFSAPAQHWSFAKKIDEVVSSGLSLKEGLFDKKFVEDLISGRVANSDGIKWMVFVFEMWFRKWAI